MSSNVNNVTKGSHYGSIDAIDSASSRHNNHQTPNLSTDHQQAIKMDESPGVIPPRPAIRQRQKVNAAKTNTNNNDLSQVQVANQDRQVSESNIIKEQQQLDEGLVELNKSLLNASDLINKRSQSDGSGKQILSLPLPSERLPDRPYPKKVLFIVANEFCERFSYYGLRTILILYLKNVLGLSDSKSTVCFHLFTALCYCTPILGAILGDSVWGKFKTILYLSITYFLGEVILVLSAIFWNLGSFSPVATSIGLFVIGLGTGGIKPCVSALGGDQFQAHEEKWRQSFFSLFYGAINLGSLISMFVTPMLRSDIFCVGRQDCYPLAFGLPCLLMFVAIIVFTLAKNHYTLVPLPEKNVLVSFYRCTWLALKRRLTGYKLPLNSQESQRVRKQRKITNQPTMLDTTSGSSLSVSSNEDGLFEVVGNNNNNNNNHNTTPIVRPIADEKIVLNSKEDSQTELQTVKQPKHWLYLASDQFDKKSIEDFRTVLSILFLFVPVPIYWCLYDQQSSLWTLQALRMDGQIYNTNFVLQPDQISVANPLIMLISIPLFEVFIYPALSYCNLLKKSIQRMTVGGLITALTFVLTALIEIRMQNYEPLAEPPFGKANLLLVNGLSECTLINPVISYVPQIQTLLTNPSGPTDKSFNATNSSVVDALRFANIEPLSAKSHFILSSEVNFLNNYQLKFKLGSINESSTIVDQQSMNSNNQSAIKRVGCPFSASMDYDLTFGPFPDRSAKLVYLDQGNGKLTHKIFNDSLRLPPAGKARLRLLYEGFGSVVQREKRQFYLLRESTQVNHNNQSSDLKKETFNTTSIEGQVTLSDYLDVVVTGVGEFFLLRTNDNLLGPNNSQRIFIKPATRNLIIVHQMDGQNVDVKLQVLQDNDYRISMLYQLGPYLTISMAEVMFGITSLEFCYAMAPDNMKSVIMAAWHLTAAIGNVLTVAIESLHLFSNVAHDALFYATLMTVDMLLFAIIGYYYKPPKSLATSNK